MIRLIKNRLNTWEEMCADESARRRTNTILFTFLVTLFYVALLVAGLTTPHPNFVLFSGIFIPISASLFTIQFSTKRYIPTVSRLFGVMALVMSAYFLGYGEMGGYAFLWIIIVPIIGAMVVPVAESLIFNAAFLAMVLAILWPLYDNLPCVYDHFFRRCFPISILLVNFCVYVTEIIRGKTQRQLLVLAQQLQSFAFTDPLTGAYNRHALLSHFQSLDSPADGLSFGVVDLDYFKRVNDSYGHMVGDQVLCHVVRLINSTLPSNALLYRWGGEEFLIVLKTGDYRLSSSILTKALAEIAQTPLVVDGRTLRITVSIGGACARPGWTIQQAVSAADQMLYKAKNNGRNQLAMEESGTPMLFDSREDDVPAAHS